MSFSLKAKQTGNNEGSNIDWEAIAEQVSEDIHDARISVIVDLGTQERGLTASYGNEKSVTVFGTEEEAEAEIDRLTAEGLIPAKVIQDKGLEEVKEVAEGFQVSFNIYPQKDAQEVAIFADLVDTEVDYGGEIGVKPYRILVNGSYQGELRGYPLVTNSHSLNKEGKWTFPSNGMLAKLSQATRHPEIVEEEKHNTDIGRILGEPLAIDIIKRGSYINCKAVSKLRERDHKNTTPLPYDPIGLTFETATAQQLKDAHLRHMVVNKIQAATNYKGSQMHHAMYEAGLDSDKPGEASDGDKAESSSGSKGKIEEAQKPTEKASGASSDVDFDSDIPF